MYWKSEKYKINYTKNALKSRHRHCVLNDQCPGQIAGAGQAHEVQDLVDVLHPIVLEHGLCVVL